MMGIVKKLLEILETDSKHRENHKDCIICHGERIVTGKQ